MPAVSPNVQIIAPFECIGDSLVKINENFFNIKTVVGDINPDVLITDSETIRLSFLSETRFLSADIAFQGVNTIHLADNVITNIKLANNSVTTEKIQDVSITTEKIVNQAITTEKIFPLSITVNELGTNAVTTSKIQDSAVLYQKLQNVSIANRVLGSTTAGGPVQEVQVQTAMIANDAVTESKILNSNVTTNKLADLAVTTGKLANNTVTTDKILNDAITTSKLVNNSVTTDKILNSNVTTDKLAAEAVTAEKLAAQSVITDKIANETITGQKIASTTISGSNIALNTISGDRFVRNTITSAELANSAVITATLASNAVTTDKINTSAVTTIKLADGAVQTDKIFNSAVTTNKIATDAVITAKIQDGAVTNEKIAPNAVTSSKIETAAVTSDALAGSSVIETKIAPGAVTSGKLINGAVTNEKIAPDAVTSSKIATAAVTSDELAGGSVIDTKIAPGAVTSGKLATSAVTTEKIDNGAVTDIKLATNAVTTLKIATEAVTTDKVNKGSIGNWWNKVSTVKSDGVVEVGRYIDFHITNDDTTDFTYRIDNTINNRLNFSGDLFVANSVVASNQLIANNECYANMFGSTHGASTRETDTIFYSSLNAGDQFIRRNTKEGTLESLGIYSIIAPMLPSIANIRISLDNVNAITTTDYIDRPNIFIHPYNGGAVGLYNQTRARWELHQIPNVIQVPLQGLIANTSYDIFMWHDGNTIRVYFRPWVNSGAGQSGIAASKIKLNGTYVDFTFFNGRYIGCLRTTAAERTTMSYGARVAGGARCRHFVWNAQNRVQTTAWSLEDGQYLAIGNPWTGWRRVNPNSVDGGRNNRFAFIIGDVAPSVVSMSAQLYASYYANLMGIVTYSGMGINDENNPSVGAGYQFIQELRGSDQCPRSMLIRPFTGFNFIQCFENIMTAGNGSNFAVTMNENHTNQTGYLATLEN